MRRGIALKSLLALTTIAGLSISSGITAHASSHREAPLIAQDPQADSTDLYAFVGNNDSGVKVLNILANYIGFEDPGGGPNYASFSPDVRYEIHVENDATMANGSPVFTGKSNLSFYIQFKTSYEVGGTFLTYGIGSSGVGPIGSVGDGYQNENQTYSVTEVNHDTGVTTVLGSGLSVPPPNTGHATPLYNQNGDGTMPARQGAMTTAQLDPYTQEGIHTIGNGIKVFAGPRLDPFYADVGAIFDLLSLRKPGENTLAGYDVHEIGLQIPVDQVATGAVPIVGVYTAASRHAVTVQPGYGDNNYTPGVPQMGTASYGNYAFGPWRQVSRLGNPLENEVFQGVSEKDYWGQIPPWADTAKFKQNVDCPQLAGVLNLVLGLKLPSCGYKVLDFVFEPDLLKVDTSTGPVRLESDAGFSRLTNFGGDTVHSPFQNTDTGSGWPLNGRRLGDDVVTLAVTAIASGPTLSPLTLATDNVDSNGLPYNHVFPFEQTPANGWLHHRVYP
jgi:hypothetical protein